MTATRKWKTRPAVRNSNNGPYGGNRGGMGGGSPWPGGGGMGGPRGGMGAQPGGRHYLKCRGFDPADSLSFTQKPEEVDVIDSRSRKIAFYTDGRKDQEEQRQRIPGT